MLNITYIQNVCLETDSAAPGEHQMTILLESVLEFLESHVRMYEILTHLRTHVEHISSHSGVAVVLNLGVAETLLRYLMSLTLMSFYPNPYLELNSGN